MAKQAQENNNKGLTGYIKSDNIPVVIQRNGVIRAVKIAKNKKRGKNIK